MTSEMIQNELALCATILDFPAARPGVTCLEDACRLAAEKALAIVEKLLPKISEEDRGALAEKLNVVRERLSGNGAATPDCLKPEAPALEPVSTHGCVEMGKEALTRRELEVLKYIAQGNTTKKVAEILGITFKTAACHRYRVMDKLGIHETASLVRYAIRRGIAEP